MAIEIAAIRFIYMCKRKVQYYYAAFLCTLSTMSKQPAAYPEIKEYEFSNGKALKTILN